MPTQTEKKKGGWGALYEVQERKRLEREQGDRGPENLSPGITPPQEETSVEQASIAGSSIERDAIEPSAKAQRSPVESFQPNTSHDATVEQPAIAQLAIAPDSFLRVPNGILDRLLPTLNPYDQLILLRLYRLSHGFGKNECTVGYQTLAVACNMSTRQAQISVERLIMAGWIARVGVEQGGQSRQGRGSIYRVNLPAAGAKAGGTIARDAIAGRADNKDKELNERIKKGARAADFSNCPDCFGTGMWYPEGYEKGVAKCKHKRLANSGLS
jgi:hypothetical protein